MTANDFLFVFFCRVPKEKKGERFLKYFETPKKRIKRRVAILPKGTKRNCTTSRIYCVNINNNNNNNNNNN